jgi:hypothetical protein
MRSVRWKSGTEYLAKNEEKSQPKTYMSMLLLASLTNFLLIAADTNFFCSLFCAAVLNKFLCFQLVSFLTDHTFTKYDMTH